MMDYYNGYGMTGGSVLGFVFSLVVMAAVIIGVYAIAKSMHGARLHSGIVQSAEDVLKTRYAKGEITKKEFEEMKKDIAA